MRLNEVNSYFDRLRADDKSVLDELHVYFDNTPPESLDLILPHASDIIAYVISHAGYDAVVRKACNLLYKLLKKCSKPALSQFMISNEIQNQNLRAIPFDLQDVFINAILLLYDIHPEFLSYEKLCYLVNEPYSWEMLLSSLRKIPFNEETKKNFVYILQNANSTVRLRLYELCCHLNEPAFWEKLKEDLRSDDALLYAACIQTMIDSVSNYEMFKEKGIVDILKEKLNDNCPKALEYFAIAIRKGVREVDPDILDYMLDAVLNKKDAFAIETLGFIWPQVHPLLSVEKIRSIGALVNELLESPSTDKKIIALKCASCILDEPTEETLSFLSVNLERILKLSLQPFVDIRLECHNVYKALLKSKCGLMKLRDLVGFKEYLLNRNTEPEFGGIDSKWKLINLVYKSPYFHEVFDSKYEAQLRKYIQIGEFVPRYRPVVADETMS